MANLRFDREGSLLSLELLSAKSRLSQLVLDSERPLEASSIKVEYIEEEDLAVFRFEAGLTPSRVATCQQSAIRLIQNEERKLIAVEVPRASSQLPDYLLAEIREIRK